MGGENQSFDFQDVFWLKCEKNTPPIFYFLVFLQNSLLLAIDKVAVSFLGRGENHAHCACTLLYVCTHVYVSIARG